MELNDEIVLFCPGLGTFKAIITKKDMCPPALQANDFKGRFFTHQGNFIWHGPKNQEYYQLDNNGKIINKTVTYMKD